MNGQREDAASVEDEFDKGGFEFNRDDMRAQRVAGLALMLMNANAPVPTASIRNALYEGRGGDAFERTFLRDRNTLSELGLRVEQQEGEVVFEGGWRLDPLATIETSGLTDEEALVVDLMCQPLCADPTFPYGRDLMLALAKVNNSFEDVLPDLPGVQLKELPMAPAALRGAFLRRVACDISYVDAKGRASERRVAVLGTFGLRGQLYFVTCPFTEEGLVRSTVKTLRADRVAAARPVPSLPYEVPDDFYVEDHIHLPFQMGPAITQGRFRIPDPLLAEIADEVGRAGSLEETDEGAILLADIADLQAAARWAIATGAVPLAPHELVDTTRAILEEAAHGRD